MKSSRPAGTAPAYLRRLPSPIGRIEVTSDGQSITSLAIERAGSLPSDASAESPHPLLERAAVQLEEYFSGKRKEFDLPLAAHGTDFQQGVWAGLRELRWGEVTSYGELGMITGRPTAGRAVGGAVGANPVPIIIPCHRVLAGNRRITGYSGGNGIPTKVWLLEHEGIEHLT